MITAVPATEEHARQLAPHLSDLDREECSVYTPEIDPETALIGGIQASRDAVALIEEGRVLAIWGVISREDDLEEFGAPWLLSVEPTKYSLTATRALLEHTRKSISKWHQWYDLLEGFSWAGAKEHHRLLLKLGFEFSDIVTVAPDGSDIPPTVYFARSRARMNEGLKYYV